jgi:hypothetical protein
MLRSVNSLCEKQTALEQGEFDFTWSHAGLGRQIYMHAKCV